MQDTPDYIRRSAARHRVAPLELFSASVSPPPPAGLGAAAEGMASSEKCRAAGGLSESEAVGGGRTVSESLKQEEIEEVIHITRNLQEIGCCCVCSLSN
jgi:kinesin family protein C2/C3